MDSDFKSIFYNRQLPFVSMGASFTLTEEEAGIRVKNENVEVLFPGWREDELQHWYNEALSHLNFNFTPLVIEGKSCVLLPAEQTLLEQQVVTHLLYFYAVHSIPFYLKEADFMHPQIMDAVIHLLDKKFRLKGGDTALSLTLGAHLLRKPPEDYRNGVVGRRRFYDR